MSTDPNRASLEGLELEIFKLVSKGASPEQWAEWLRAPLEHAAAEGNLGVVSSLLLAGAKPDVKMLLPAPSSPSALYLAVDSGHEAVARRLAMAGADVNFKNPENGLTVLHRALLGGHERLAEDLIMCGCDVKARALNGNPPLHLAVLKGLEGVVSALLLKGVEKDAVDNDGDSALMWACGAAADVQPKLAVVETLLAAGVDVNSRTPDRFSALHWASQNGWVPILQAVVRRGADVNSRSSTGCSALHAAAGYDQACAVDALIEAGADIELKGNNGQTPLAYAAANGKAKSLLALLHHGASVGSQDEGGDTPLHLACYFQREGLEVVVDLLLRWGADETAVDEDGRAPAVLLDIEQAYRSCSQDEIDRVRLLLDRAPADRAWRRRGWLVVLRARASSAGSNSYDSSGSAGLEGSHAAGGAADEGRKTARRDAATGDASGEQWQASPGGGGNEVLHGAVDWLVGMEPAGVFRTVLEFL